MAGGKGNIRPEDGKQFSSEYQPSEKWTEKRSLDLGNELIAWLREEDENIFFEEFLIIKKDLYLDLIRYLSNKFSSFSELIKKAKKVQEIKLYKFGTFDKLNATMTKFVLINEHGKVSDNSKLDHTTKGDKISNTVQIGYSDMNDAD